ncbi:kinase-like domain-containing protein [Phascolomyces articulosus]|uniref:Kinase-like domain-containing protein n=1 Tax=Phascolomyces articulosus TaxID=60185 RepID=A0AAD5PIX7_9FUNG|nr:kinase-like domain-containing protein [Phascolomyces articulosus]
MVGTFSTVEKQELEKRLVAVKKYKKHHGQLVQRHYQRELWALRTLGLESETLARNNRVIYLLDAESTHGAHYLTFPYYEHTLLEFVEERNQPFALKVIHQVAQGLDFLHSKGIIHCDLSPSNILVDEANQHLVLADFGCAHLDSSSTSTYPDANFNSMEEIGTRYYKAPEHLFGYRVYQPATDVWSLGTIFCHLLLGHPIFDGQSDLEQIGILVRALGAPSAKVKSEEMSVYPDFDKLVFFGDSQQQRTGDDEDNEFTDDEENDHYDNDDDNDEEDSNNEQPDIAKMPNAKPFGLGTILHESLIEPSDQTLIRRMLTWSLKERITVKEILKLVHPPE